MMDSIDHTVATEATQPDSIDISETFGTDALRLFDEVEDSAVSGAPDPEKLNFLHRELAAQVQTTEEILNPALEERNAADSLIERLQQQQTALKEMIANLQTQVTGSKSPDWTLPKLRRLFEQYVQQITADILPLFKQHPESDAFFESLSNRKQALLSQMQSAD
jgi:hypothetical protein